MRWFGPPVEGLELKMAAVSEKLWMLQPWRWSRRLLGRGLWLLW